MLLINFVADLKAAIPYKLIRVICGFTAHQEVSRELRQFNQPSIKTNTGFNAMFNGITMDFEIDGNKIAPLITFDFAGCYGPTFDIHDIINDNLSISQAAAAVIPYPTPSVQSNNIQVNPHWSAAPSPPPPPPSSSLNFLFGSSQPDPSSLQSKFEKMTHQCTMKTYIGFTDCYDYCTICDKKVYK